MKGLDKVCSHQDLSVSVSGVMVANSLLSGHAGLYFTTGGEILGFALALIRGPEAEEESDLATSSHLWFDFHYQ